VTHARLTTLLRALLALLALALFAPAQAQQIAGNNMRATLIADGPPVPGKTWTVALHFVPKSPEWHGYWKNPGDAGVGMVLKWRLPEGWSAGEPLYPVPKRLVISGLMNHVFEGEYAVLVPIAVPADAAATKMGPIGLEADYLACTDRICVPERARLTLDPVNAAQDPRFDRWRAALAPLLDRPVSYEVSGRLLRLAIPLPRTLAVTEPHVFIENRDLIDYVAVQNFSRQGDTLVAEVPLAETVVPPGAIAGILSLSPGNSVRFAGERGAVPAAGVPLKTATAAAAPELWLALAGALLGGLLLNIMPCVFPILSLKALALAKAGGEERQVRRDALAYTAGVVIACLALGAVMLALRAGGEQVGWAFQLQEPGVVLALFLLATVLTANFLGVFEIPGMALAGGRLSRTGSFGTGLLAAFVATPCTGPFMAAALGAALLLPALQALLLFAALGLGLALPFLLLGFIPALRERLPRPGLWMVTFRRWMALPMGLTGLALAWLVWRLGGMSYLLAAVGLAAIVTALLALVWGRRRVGERTRTAALAALGAASVATIVVMPEPSPIPSARAEAGVLDAEPFSELALSEARASGKPVFVYFTADWCLTCKVNEGAAIERETTREAFEKAGVTVLRGDWTRRDEAITRFLTAQGVAGVPLYLWYPPGGGSQPRQLPQVLTPTLLAELADGSAA
jgi:DsbC/DsbD-like thiol-disulfide interchange protein/cytochrome c biogenesis protein CcdA